MFPNLVNTLSGKKVLRTLIHLLNITFVEDYFGFLIQVFHNIPKIQDSWQSVPEGVVRASMLRASEIFMGRRWEERYSQFSSRPASPVPIPECSLDPCSPAKSRLN